ncbi:DegT/DnrJ/EryC1/StrS family aminotransferase [bacterium]|nr:DegT/DnrJ/EryC1/StrS family aminotransferase [bacterium]
MAFQFITSSQPTKQHGFDLIRILKNHFSAPEVFITGRGAAAIYAALKAIGKPGNNVTRDYVGVPSHICASVPLAIISAGYKPWFVDIDKRDFNLDVQAINTIPDKTAAVIAPHIYGHPLNIEKLVDFCKEKNIILIEDIAQAVGAKIRNRLLGTFGDMAVMSFHPSKLIDGAGGGALIVNNQNLCFIDKLKNEIKNLPPVKENLTARLTETSSRINPLLNSARDFKCNEKEIERIYLANIDLIPSGANPNSESVNINAFSSLGRNIEIRTKRSLMYQSLIRNERIRHPELKRGTPLFRHTILIQGEKGIEQSKRITDHLRANQIHASNLYYPAHLIFSSDTRIQPSNAEWVAGRIINLWLDDTADEDYIRKTAELINDIL